MNLASIIKEIKTITGYTPDQQNYDTKIVEMINQSYMEVWTSFPWNFATKEAELATYPDIKFTSNAFEGIYYMYALLTDPNSPLEFVWRNHFLWIGQTIYSRGIAYRIVDIIFFDNFGGLGQPGIIFALDKPVRSTDAPASLPITSLDPIVDEDALLIYSKIPLPDDLIEPLYIGIRDQNRTGKIEALAARTEESLNLWLENQGDWPLAYVNLPTVRIPPAGQLFATVQAIEPDPEGSGPDKRQYFGPGHYYEFCWAYKSDSGFTGPLSEPVTVRTQSGAAQKITLLFRDQFGDPINTDRETFGDDVISFQGVLPNAGLWKQVFVNINIERSTGVRKGPPVWVVVTGSPDSTMSMEPPQNWDGPGRWLTRLPLLVSPFQDEVDLFFVQQVNPANPRYIDYDGIHQQVRLWPRCTGFSAFFRSVPNIFESGEGGTTEFLDALGSEYYKRLQIRYRYKPPLLGLPSDAPQLPYPLYQVLVWHTASKLYASLGNPAMSTMYERKADKALQEASKRYVVRTDMNWRRGDWFTNLDYRHRVLGPVTYRG